MLDCAFPLACRMSGAPLRSEALPPLARRLGYAGLLPQAAALVVVLRGDPAWHFAALVLGFAYAALILSFLGGLWWGLAAQARAPVPSWVWVAAVAPSLVALVSTIPWLLADARPGASLGLLAVALLASLIVDYTMAAAALAPVWWLRLRLPLSIGLGLLTLVLALVA